MRTSIPLVKVLGIPISLNYSWFLTFGFVTLLLSLQVYPAWLPDAGAPVHWLLGIISGLLFFASILLHELAHSLVAKAYGIQVKGITLFILGGVAHITKEAKRPLAEFAMAVAGPATSVSLAALFLLIWWLVGFSSDEPITAMLGWLCLMNLVVALFNSLPGFPMDGGRVLRSILWGITGDYRRATFIASWCGRGVAYLLIGAGIAAVIGVLPWLSPFGGLWFVFVGFYLEGVARQSWQQIKVLEFLRGYKAADVMSREYVAVSSQVTLGQVAREHLSDIQNVFLFVTENERVVGLLSYEQLRAVPRARWETVTVGEAMTPSSQATVVGPEVDVAAILQNMEGETLRHMPVVEGGRLVGLVSRDALMRLLVAHRVLR